MGEYCENCGAKLNENAKFCSKCGANINETPDVCPHCGDSIKDSENYCENCGFNLNSSNDLKKGFFTKNRIILIAVAIIIIFIVIFAGQSLVNQSVEKQLITVDNYEFYIPADFKENPDANKNNEYDGIYKEWTNDNGDTIDIMILEITTNDDADTFIASLGGSKDTKYGIDGYYNQFTEGGGAFSYSKDNKMISIMVSNDNLFNQIELPGEK